MPHDQDQGVIPVSLAVGLGGLEKLLHLIGPEVLPGTAILVTPPDCRTYAAWGGAGD